MNARPLSKLILWAVALAAPSASAQPDAVPQALLATSAEATLLRLDDALSRAARANQDIATATERATQAAARRDRAWASFKPNLRLQGQYVHRDQEVAFGGRIITRQDDLTATMSASMQLVDARAIKSIQASYEALRAARSDAEAVRRAILWETARTYWSSAAADMLVAVVRRNVDKATVSLETARVRLDGEVGIPIDVSRAELVLLQAQRDLLAAENVRDTLLELLRFLTDADTAVRVEAPSRTVVVPADATIAEAAAQRPELVAARARLLASEHLADGAWWSMLPKLSVVFNYQASESAGIAGDTDSWDIRLVAEWLVYDGGARYADIEETAAEQRIGALALDRAEKALARDVRRLALDLKAAIATVATAERQRDVALEQYGLVHARADLGEATSLEVSDADVALFTAETELVRARLQRDLAAMDLLEALSVDPLSMSSDRR
ncbi:MAG: hypothetical protein AMXMBFR64_58170 [Myxococcales bacterium]